MFGEIDCMLTVFDPGHLLVVRVGNLNESTNELRMFDPVRLLVIRMGNLNDLTNELGVFDPGRLLVVRVGNLNESTNELRVFNPGRLLVVRVGNLNELPSSSGHRPLALSNRLRSSTRITLLAASVWPLVCRCSIELVMCLMPRPM